MERRVKKRLKSKTRLNGGLATWVNRYNADFRGVGNYGDDSDRTFSRIDDINAATGLVCINAMKLCSVPDVTSIANKGSEVAIEYFSTDWWRGNQRSAREMNVEKFRDGLKWFAAFTKGVFLALLTKNDHALSTIMSWPKVSTKADFCDENQERELGSVYKYLAFNLFPPRSGRGISRLVEDIGRSKEPRPRYLLDVVDSLKSGDHFQAVKSLEDAVACFAGRNDKNRFIATDWIDISASVFAMSFEKFGFDPPVFSAEASSWLVTSLQE